MESFLSQYLAYTEDSESPRIFHRWSALTSISAMLGRNFTFEHGHFSINPNVYVMLIGNPGTRKSTAIKVSKKLIVGAGYDTIAADKTSKEKFLVDLEGEDDETLGKMEAIEKELSKNLFGNTTAPREVYVMADEFNDFIGINNIEFVSLLGTLWDYEGIYKSRIKTGKSVAITEPTVNILGGNTQQNFATAFPPALIGQGFLSRLILIHGESTGIKITFPKRPPEEATLLLVKSLQEMQLKIRGRAILSSEAEIALDTIYNSWEPLEDMRFQYYSTRRFTQLIKLCLVCAASFHSTTIEYTHVIEANTYLSAAEYLMPKALGEFGKNKDSDVANKILDALGTADRAMNTGDLWPVVYRDLKTQMDMGQILLGLEAAGKIHHAKGHGWLIKRSKPREFGKFFNPNFLTKQEREDINV